MLARDETALHQMRVALRRLRAAISLFSVVVGDDRASGIKAELRWIAQELGPARDLDTLLSEVITSRYGSAMPMSPALPASARCSRASAWKAIGRRTKRLKPRLVRTPRAR